MDIQRLFATILLVAACDARAVGGHFDVDDATILDPGHCQVETWAVNARHPSIDSLHVGPACHMAGMEWGLNADRVRSDGATVDTLGPQVKWVADPTARRFGIGAVVAVAWRDAAPHRPVATVYVPATLWLGEGRALPVHLNLGRDHDPVAGTFRRWGVASDLSLDDRWMLTLERRSLLGDTLTRLGVRRALPQFAPLASIDVSVARGVLARTLAVGLNWEWER